MWIRKCDLDADTDFRPPVPTQIVSNEEFVPPPQSPELKAVEVKLSGITERNSRKLGMDRRAFLGGACGMAASLLALNAVFGPMTTTCRRRGEGSRGVRRALAERSIHLRHPDAPCGCVAKVVRRQQGWQSGGAFFPDAAAGKER